MALGKWPGDRGLAVGIAAGAVVASVVDGWVLARKPRTAVRQRGVLSVGAVDATPTLAPNPDGGMTAGLVGTF